MIFNRSAPNARVTPVLTVADVREAVAWYGEVLGFVEHVRIGEGHRAQLGLPGGGEMVVAEARPGRTAVGAVHAHQIMLKVEDAADVLERARARGVRILDELNDWEYGERQAAFTDPFGHTWVITQTLVDTHPTAWGGTLVTPRPPGRV